MTNKEVSEFLDQATGGIMTSRIKNIQTALRANGLLKNYSEDFTPTDYAWFIYALFVSPHTSYNKAVEWIGEQKNKFWIPNFGTGYETPIDVLAGLFNFRDKAAHVGVVLMDTYTGLTKIQWNNGAVEDTTHQKIYQLPPAGQLIRIPAFIDGQVIRHIADTVYTEQKKKQEQKQEA